MADLTREQVWTAIVPAWEELDDPECVVDAVMALLAEAPPHATIERLKKEASALARAEAVVLRERVARLEAEAKRAAEAPRPRVLWRGDVSQIAASLLGKKPSARGWDPYMRVVVIEDTEGDRDG